MNDSNQHPLLKIKIIFFAISAFFLVFTAVTVIVFLTVFRVHAVDIENCKYSSKENIEKFLKDFIKEKILQKIVLV